MELTALDFSVLRNWSSSVLHPYDIERLKVCHLIKQMSCVYDVIIKELTNRFHIAVRLFSNKSQMTSKCGKNKKVAHETIAECVTDVLTTF